MIGFVKEVLLLFLCSSLIYVSGVVMNYISDNHKDKEWINSIIACFDILVIAISIILILRLIYAVLPLALMVVGGLVLMGALIIVLMYIINKLTNLLKK